MKYAVGLGPAYCRWVTDTDESPESVHRSFQSPYGYGMCRDTLLWHRLFPCFLTIQCSETCVYMYVCMYAFGHRGRQGPRAEHFRDTHARAYIYTGASDSTSPIICAIGELSRASAERQSRTWALVESACSSTSTANRRSSKGQKPYIHTPDVLLCFVAVYCDDCFRLF